MYWSLEQIVAFLSTRLCVESPVFSCLQDVWVEVFATRCWCRSVGMLSRFKAFSVEVEVVSSLKRCVVVGRRWKAYHYLNTLILLVKDPAALKSQGVI